MNYAKKTLAGLLFGMLLALFARGDWCDIAYAQSPDKADVIVTIDDVPIARQDLENAISDRVRRGFGLNYDDKRVRLTILRDLIVEIMAEKLVTDKEITKSPLLARKLETSRRQLLLEYYIDKKAIPQPPTEEEVKKYISEHPNYFQDRKTFHYAQLIIDTKSAAVFQAVGDRLKRLTELKEPSPQAVQMVLDWLKTNNILYGYAKAWQASEQIAVPIEQTLRALGVSGNKVDIQNQGLQYRVFVLYGTYPDPVDPLLAREGVAEKLAKDSKLKQLDGIANDMLTRANIVLYDQSFKDLKIPKFSAGRVEARQPLGERIFLAWNFAVLIFAPVALYLFFLRQIPEVQEYESRTVIDLISSNIVFRVAVVVILGAFLLLPALKVLQAEYMNQDVKTYMTMAAGGLGFGLAVVFLCVKIDVLKRLLSSGWLAVSALFIIQVGSLLLFE